MVSSARAERRGRGPWVAPALALALLAGGCAVERPSADPAPSPTAAAASVTEASPTAVDLVLLWVAGLRADAPGTEGAEEAFFGAISATPTVRYRGAYAQSASPFISLGTVLTGRYASAIPMCGTYVGSAGAGGGQRAWCADIPDDRVTLPELAALYGYRTALVTSGKPEMEAIADEFQAWIDVPVTGGEAAADWTALQQQVRDWWAADAGAPRLLVVLADDLTATAIPAMQTELGMGQRMRRGLAGAYEGLTDADRERARRIYADAAREDGRRIDALMSTLDGGARPRVTFVGSTNGVNLLESTGFVQEPVYPFDAGMVLDRTVRVPLAAYRSDAVDPTTVEVDGLVELRALYPTLVGLSGAQPPAKMDRADLLATDAPPAADARIYTEFGDMLGLRTGRHLIVFRGFLHDGNSVDPELDRRLNDIALTTEPDHYVVHDVVADPWQAEDLSGADPELFRQLRGALLEVRGNEAAVPLDVLTPERLWELRMSPTQGYW